MSRILTIRCSKCKKKNFRYLKIGTGRVLHCWRGRILEDYSIHEGLEIKCQCGNLIGIGEEKWIKMKQNAIIY